MADHQQWGAENDGHDILNDKHVAIRALGALLFVQICPALLRSLATYVERQQLLPHYGGSTALAGATLQGCTVVLCGLAGCDERGWHPRGLLRCGAGALAGQKQWGSMNSMNCSVVFILPSGPRDCLFTDQN